MNDIFHVFQNQNFIDLCMYQFGYAQNDPLSSFGPHVRSHYLFHYVISGTGKLQATDTKGCDHTYYIRSGEGFLIVPEQITTYTADEARPWEYTWIEFDGMHAKEAMLMAGLTADQPVYHSTDQALSSRMKDSMLYICHHREETPFHLMSYLYMFLDCLMRSSRTRTAPKTEGMSRYYLEWAMTFIDQNFHTDISVADIADSCKIHRNYLGKIFRENLGTSPQEFLINFRMKKSVQLLTATKLSIKDIGNAVGYPNQLHFSRAFKSVYGMSPREYRSRHYSGPLN